MDKNSLAYKKAFSEANKIYGTKSNIYRSSYIVQKYKDYGGTFTEKRNSRNEILSQWYKEKWISVIPYLEKGEIIKCGSSSGNEGCRPLIRINKKTPITINELLQIHSKQDLLKMAYLKKMNPDIRVNWKELTFTI
jgi:hypothetical protein